MSQLLLGVRPCPLCQSAQEPVLRFTERVLDGHRHNWPEPWKTAFTSIRVVQCTGCGFSYVWEDIPEELLIAHYQHPMNIQQEFDHRDCKRQLYAHVLSRFSAAKGQLLDIGCFEGALLSAARDRGWGVTGVEVDAKCAGFTRAVLGLTVVNERLERAGLSDDTFDAVTLIDVLEHLKHPVRTLREVHRVLKVGGEVVISVPNAPVQYVKEKWARRLIGDARGVADVVHLNQFTRRTLTFALKSAGLEPLQFEVPPVHYAPKAHKGLKFRIINLFRGSYYWLSRAADRAGVPVGASILVIAKKTT